MLRKYAATNLLALVGFTAVCWWPLTSFLSLNFAQLSINSYGPFTELFVIVGVVFAIGIGLALVSGLLSGAWPARVLAVLSVAVFATFVSAEMRQLFVWLTGWSDADNGGTTAGVGMAIVLTAAAAWGSKFGPFRNFVAIASIICLAIPLISLAGNRVALVRLKGSNPPPSHRTVEPDLRNEFSGNNVYFVVLDGYARSDILARHGFDNSSFLMKMQNYGFFIDPVARTNYTTTHITLMSLLEMDYVVTDATPRYHDRSAFYPAALNNGKTPRVVREFAANGYTTFRASNPWGGCNENVFDTCYLKTERDMDYVLGSFLAPTLVSRLLPKPDGLKEIGPLDDAVGVVSRRYFEIKQREPFFLFAHNMGPHYPFRYNEDCSPRNPALNEEKNVAAYLNGIRCINEQVLFLTDRIVRQDPNATIVFLSDHGTDFTVDWSVPEHSWSKDAIFERGAILRMMRLPNRCRSMLRPGQGQINTMRVVLTCLGQKNLEQLPEQTFIAVYENNSEFGKVTRVTGAN